MKSPVSRFLLLGLVSSGFAHAADDAASLANKLASVYKAGDMDAALALFNTGNPQAIRDVYMDHVADCFEDNLKDYRCSINAAPIPGEFKQALAQHEIDSEPAPEGFINVQKNSSTSKSYEHSVSFPYARVNGKYVITGFQMSAHRLAELKRTTSQSLTDKLLEGGPYLQGGRDPQWKSRAHALAPGGGEPGLALVARTSAIAAALKANDVSAMIAAEGAAGKYRYPETGSDGKPISLRQRQLSMRSKMGYDLVDVKVLGGYQLDDFAVLTIEGRNGSGWLVRGWKSMRRIEGKWEKGGDGTVSFPDA